MRTAAPTALAATALFAGMLAGVPANAGTWPPPAPLVNDACGTKQDRFFLAGEEQGYNVGWFRGTNMPTGPSEDYLPSGWISTGGASSVTVTPYNREDSSQRGPSHTLSFTVTSDADCVEAQDSVTAVVGACNTTTGGTTVDLTYTNTDDATDWSHVAPQVDAILRTGLGTQFLFEPTGQLAVPDGGSLRLVDGASLPVRYPRPFFSPGTYTLRLRTPGGGMVTLPNRISVPACGKRLLPWGDALVGKAFTKVGECRSGRVKVTLNNQRAIAPVKYELTVFRNNRAKRRDYLVPANKVKTVVLKKQVSRTWIGASPYLDSIPRRAAQNRKLVC